MKKILNPYIKTKGDTYNCFGCSPKNNVGLKLEFWDAGEEIICYWKPKKDFEGYVNVIHGGIQSLIMDEIASWTIYTKCETAGVTSNLNVKYKQPLQIDDKDIIIRGRIESQKRNLVTIKTTIENSDGKICSEGLVTYFTFAKDVAKEKYMYPGIEAFYE